MLKRLFGLAAPLALAAAALAQQQPATTSAPAQTAPPPQTQPSPVAPQTHLKVGDPAPDFTLRDTEGKEVKLSNYKGTKSVVLAFYVLAFTGG